jgi:hypothetical protein
MLNYLFLAACERFTRYPCFVAPFENMAALCTFCKRGGEGESGGEEESAGEEESGGEEESRGEEEREQRTERERRWTYCFKIAGRID